MFAEFVFLMCVYFGYMVACFFAMCLLGFLAWFVWAVISYTSYEWKKKRKK